MPAEQTRTAWDGRVSDWRDPLDGPMGEIAARYGQRAARSDVARVDKLHAALGLRRARLSVVVVGSNGKTSTATYLADLFAGAGCRTGLYTSPHIAYWTERVRVDDTPVDGDALVAAVREVDALALRDEGLRFFDVLTLAAAKLFADCEVDVAIYEAGIGGRVDATRSLRPELVVLTGVALEHTQLLGATEEEILRHKLDVAPVGGTVVAGSLRDPLALVARDHARAIGVRLDHLATSAGPAGLPRYLGRNWRLALQAGATGAEWLGVDLPDRAAPRAVYGRFTSITRTGVNYVVDVAHNLQAWEAFLGELRERLGGTPAVGVVALTSERSLAEFAEAVAGSRLFTKVYATTTTVRPTHEPDALAAAIDAQGVEVQSETVPGDAFEQATEYARGRGAAVAVFGSTFLVTDAMSWLEEPPPFGSRAAAPGRY